jgi:hypothetical protein
LATMTTMFILGAGKGMKGSGKRFKSTPYG